MDLRRKEYKEFIVDQMVKPYMDLWPDGEKTRYSHALYTTLPYYLSDNPELEEMIFNRLAKYIKRVERDYFPRDRTGSYIIRKMQAYGVSVVDQLITEDEL